jgi:type III pantothenate kinase
MNDNLFLLDIGNTRSKWVIAAPTKIIQLSNLTGAIAHEELKLGLTNLQSIISQSMSSVFTIIYSNVGSDEVVESWLNFFKKHFPQVRLLEFDSTKQHPSISNRYLPNQDLGNDRWAAVYGASSVAKPGDFLVINAGTATTIDYVDAKNQFNGGWIIPGLQMMLQSLGTKTAHLPILETDQSNFLSTGSFGNNTVDGIFFGVLHAQLGSIQIALAHHPKLQSVFLTGGNAHILAGGIKQLLHSNTELIIEPFLVLNGLRSWFNTLQNVSDEKI